MSYLAEVDQRRADLATLHVSPAEPAMLDTAGSDHPHRMPWARPGGVARIVAWADAALRAQGIRRTAAPTQVRTWNLSLILRLDTTAGAVWCKAVPPFFGHEGKAIELLTPAAPDLMPPLIAHGGGRLLLRHVPGRDQYDADADADAVVGLVERFVPLQARMAPRLGATAEWGIRCWTTPPWWGPYGRIALRRASGRRGSRPGSPRGRAATRPPR